MKNLMPWIKANVAIVVLSAVILLILPAAFVGSSMWNSKIRKGRERVVNEKMTALSAAGVSYTLPPAGPGAAPTPFPWPSPNPVATAFFRENRKTIDDQVKKVTVVAEAINKAGHAALIDGVFPTPTSTTKTLDFAEALVGKGSKPSAYKLLLDKIKAGGSADQSKVAEVLQEAAKQAMERHKAEHTNDKLTDEEQKTVNDDLSKIRIGQYMAHARDISVFATTDALPPNILHTIPSEPPAITDCWRWQEDYWVVSDLLASVGEANKGNAGKGVEGSVVKRIESMSVLPLGGADPISITGRKNAAANKSYDVRYAQMKVIVSSSRLPQFINAISRTDFMTVTNVEFGEVDRYRDLDLGYYYGDEHVVEATLTIESIWLRSWTTLVMPEAEKTRRESVPEEAAVAAAAPVRAPAPRAEDEGSKPKPKVKGSTKRPGAKKGGD